MVLKAGLYCFITFETTKSGPDIISIHIKNYIQYERINYIT